MTPSNGDTSGDPAGRSNGPRLPIHHPVKFLFKN